MMNMINSAQTFFDLLDFKVKDRKEELLQKWKEAGKFPRKKKKKIRKRLFNEFSIIYFYNSMINN